LIAAGTNQLRAQVTLPPTPLTRLRAAAVSPDFRWVAVSERTRGVVWDASQGQRVTYVRDFDGAYVDEAGTVFADLPSAGSEPRAIMRLDAPTRTLGNAGEVTDRWAWQHGRWLLAMRLVPPNIYPPQAVELELKDITTSASRWKKSFSKLPPSDAWFHEQSDAVVLAWFADSPDGREVIRQDPAL
jgi:hypothetical protein